MKASSDLELKSAIDYQQLIDDVESLMASTVGVDQAILESLHARFEKAVRSTNARLRECDQLLKKGLRNEAIERCEVEPKLLDLFLIIDFPERDSWEDTVRQCGLVPTELLSSIASDLNDAYASEKPLADLKYQVRLHALARSPLPVRIGLLRSLVKQDPSTTIWEEDLQIFEQARHNQLAEEIRSRIKARDSAALELLTQELQSTDWTTPPAKALSKQVAEALKALKRENAREELQALEPKLIAAFAAFDVPLGREVRESWQNWSEVAALSKSDPLMISVTPALQWLKEQDQQEGEQRAYAKAVALLTKSLDDGSGRQILEQQYQALIALEQGVPEELQQRLEERLRVLERARTRKLQMWTACVGIVVLLIALSIAFTIREAGNRSYLQSQVEVLDKMLEDKNLVGAEQQLTKLEADFPHFATAPEIQRIKSQLNVAQEQEKVRKVEFNELIVAAQRDGIESATMGSIPTARGTLRKAWDLASDAEEKTQINDVSHLIDEKLAALQKTADDQFNQDFTRTSEALSQQKSAPLDNLVSLELLKSEAAKIALREEISDQSRDKVRQLADEIDVAINKGQKLQSESRFLLDLNASLGDRAKFFAVMNRYVESPDFAGTSRHSDFSRAVKLDALLIAGYQEWSIFLDDLVRRDPTALDSAIAKKVQHDAEKLMKEHPGFPYIVQIRDCIAYLSKSAEREKGSKPMVDLLKLEMFKALSVTSKDKATSKDKRYYLPSNIQVKNVPPINVKYFIDSEFKTTKSVVLNAFESEPGWLSPQAIFGDEAKSLLRTLEENKGANWDATFIDLLDKLYKSNMDPILKVQLIYLTVKYSADGSSFLPKRLDRVKVSIEREKLSQVVNWVSPDDAGATQVRNDAEQLLGRLANDFGNLKGILAESQQLLESFKHFKFDTRYVWTGWMHRDQDGKWTCSFRKTDTANSKDGNLYALIKSESGQINFVLVGQFQQGRPKLDATAKELLEGRPIFEKKP